MNEYLFPDEKTAENSLLCTCMWFRWKATVGCVPVMGWPQYMQQLRWDNWSV